MGFIQREDIYGKKTNMEEVYIQKKDTHGVEIRMKKWNIPGKRNTQNRDYYKKKIYYGEKSHIERR